MWYWISSSDASSGRLSTALLLFLVVRAGRLVLLRLVVERLVRNAEDLGGLAAVAVGHVQRLFDDDALDLLHRLAEGDLHGVAVAALARAEELVGEAVDRQRIAAGHDERAVDHVAQLAHVAVPLVLLQRLDEVGVDVLHLLLFRLVQLLQEEMGEERDILEALAQRRDLAGEDGEAVVEVLAHLPVLNGLLRIAVRRGDDARIDVDLLVAADAPELALLEHAQELDLQLDRHLRDLVEEHRPALGQLEVALAALDGVRERALLMAEDLRLDQRRRDRAAVEGDERFVAPARKRVDRVRHDLLARARLADDEDVRVGVRDHLDLFEELLHPRRLADQVPERAHLLQLPAQLEDLLLHELLVFDGLEDDLQAREVHRLRHVILGADLERLHRRVDGGVAGEDDDGDVGIGLFDAVQQIETAAVGELQVDDGDVGDHLGDRAPAGLDGVGDFRFVSPLLDHVGHAGARRAIIVDDQHFSHRSPSGNESRKTTLSRS